MTFECSVENGPFGTCTSPFTFTVIVDTSNNGQHQFAVRAVDLAGNVSASASYKWKVEPDIGFTITGDASGLALSRPLAISPASDHEPAQLHDLRREPHGLRVQRSGCLR